MIELVFAIVIIGIVFLAIPTMIQSDSDSLQDSLVQEGIYALTAQMTQDSTYYWDASSVSADGDTNVVDIAGGTASLARDANVFRNGHIEEDTHRRFHTTPINATGVFDTTPNDLNDLNQSGANIFTTTASIVSSTGYKNSYQYTTTISYIPDTMGIDYNTSLAAVISATTYTLSAIGSATSSNMKFLEYSLSLNGEAIAVMRNYSANIGGIEYYKKSF